MSFQYTVQRDANEFSEIQKGGSSGGGGGVRQRRRAAGGTGGRRAAAGPAPAAGRRQGLRGWRQRFMGGGTRRTYVRLIVAPYVS